jgi:hypothetical protein
MTDPITPPSELVLQWEHEWNTLGRRHPDATHTASYVAIRAAQWGADQELEACCEYVYERLKLTTVACIAQELRAARRPKPPSLKEQAIAALSEMSIEPCLINDVDVNAAVCAKYNTIRRALEALPDNSAQQS